MSMSKKSFEDLVLERVEALKKGVQAIEIEAGLPPDAIRNVIRSSKKSGPTLTRAREICDALGLEFYIGPPRETGDIPHRVIQGNDYATVPFYPIETSDELGAQGNSEKSDYAFSRSWLTKQGVAPQNTAMLRVRGDSMAPKIVDGDVLLIDTARREPPIRPQTKAGKVRSGIYVVDVDGETRVKRVERPDFQNLILYSEDTTNYPPEAFLGRDQERLNFIGKVIWWGHTVDF
ncbi:helix-turn-helix transcriptional regulator [Yoonia sp. R2-816]|uniref:S24 family peptidase n=1 Tax=Yoonia sp. R2-816 TaxID=3342638 RepID=UPI003728AA67